MKLALHTVICCCVFTTVLPLVKGATGELNTSLKKRFRVWLQSRMKRDLDDGLATSDELCSDLLDRLRQDVTENNVPPSPSSGPQIRSKRATSSKSAGCKLVTCSLPDLIFKLYQNTNTDIDVSAPGKHLTPIGYGRRRRRRSLLDVVRPALQTGSQRPKTAAGQPVRRLKSKLKEV
ncbi:pro-adrenomedullin [Labrus mixtus]|uniref:pro-adrenomedullin n=1 Tax=Labrus mixtus TaxID=508554 RepID=UPI0029C09422|nr:pro-adrenomedullin [Labrus mixtus]